MVHTARALMVQGTTSNAGKSALVTGLARVFARRGVSVAPFKSQNMALAATTLPDGARIGTAQAVQAHAAGTEPAADMNPILLMPSSQTGSDVLIDGFSVGHMSVREYHAYQPTAWEHAVAAFDRLRAAHDLVLIEGAGSPAEINLRGRDIANMAVALHASAPVILVVDIDRGGAFAHLVGTMELLTPEERALIAGFVINRFRGDASLLDEGIAYLEERYAVPVLGVVPFVEGWKGDAEDSLALESVTGADDPDIVIGVIRTPYLTSGNAAVALSREPGVGIRWIDRADDLAGVDAIVVPATSAPAEVAAWMDARRLGEGLREVAASTPVLDLTDAATASMVEDAAERRPWVDSLRASRGLGPAPSVAAPDPIDVFADVLEEALDLPALFGIVGIAMVSEVGS